MLDPADPAIPPLRVFMIGGTADRPSLTVLAESGTARAVSHATLDGQVIQTIRESVGSLRSFIEAGTPVLTERDLEQIGSRLFDIMFTGAARRVLDATIGRGSKSTALEIYVEDPAMATWPWEYVYDQDRRMHLCRGLLRASRGMFNLNPVEKVDKSGHPISILMVTGFSGGSDLTPASSADGEAAEADATWRKDVFEAYLNREGRQGGPRFRLDAVATPTREELRRRIVDADGKYEVFHFIGHGGLGRDGGYLNLNSRGSDGRMPARDLASLLAGRGYSVVFLNACETARNAPTEGDWLWNSISAELINHGIPAVVGTQYSIPSVNAQYMASTFYNALAEGKALHDAMFEAREAMKDHRHAKFYDWGIPVLYSSGPYRAPFKPQLDDNAAAKPRRSAAPTFAAPEVSGAPSVLVESTVVSESRRVRVRAALVDIDAKVESLAAMVERANREQDYFGFRVAYVPVPSGIITSAVETQTFPRPQIYLPRIEEFFREMPAILGVEHVACLTQHRIAGVKKGSLFYNHISARLRSNRAVALVSTDDVREWARTAGLSFGAAILRLSLARFVGVSYHPETVGCLFDRAQRRADKIEGLKKRSLDHAACRAKVVDKEMLSAIDRLLALEG